MEKQIEVEKTNNAIEAEMAKGEKTDAIESEMRREEFAPLVDEIITQNSAVSNNFTESNSEISINKEEYNEIAPTGSLKETFNSIKDRTSAFIESSKVDLPDALANNGLEATREEVNMFGSVDSEKLPTIGSIIKDNITEFISDQAFEKSYDYLKEQISLKLAADPNNEYDKNIAETAVEIHPLTGFLPRLIKSGFNVPSALYEQGKAYVEKGMKNLGLAVDTTLDNDKP